MPVNWNVPAFRAQMIRNAWNRMQVVAGDMLACSRFIVPVDTGLLKNSLHLVTTESTHTIALVGDTSYAFFVEMGTAGRRGQPYLRPALLAAPGFWRAHGQTPGVDVGFRINTA